MKNDPHPIGRGIYRTALLLTALALPAILASAGLAQTVTGQGAAPPPPSQAVTGTAEVSAPPDRAVVSLGAVVEAKNALDAQKQIAQVMQRVVKEIKAQGLPEEKIRTAGLSLSPVYSHPAPKAGQEPKAPTQPPAVQCRFVGVARHPRTIETRELPFARRQHALPHSLARFARSIRREFIAHAVCLPRLLSRSLSIPVCSSAPCIECQNRIRVIKPHFWR